MSIIDDPLTMTLRDRAAFALADRNMAAQAYLENAARSVATSILDSDHIEFGDISVKGGTVIFLIDGLKFRLNVSSSSTKKGTNEQKLEAETRDLYLYDGAASWEKIESLADVGLIIEGSKALRQPEPEPSSG